MGGERRKERGENRRVPLRRRVCKYPQHPTLSGSSLPLSRYLWPFQAFPNPLAPQTLWSKWPHYFLLWPWVMGPELWGESFRRLLWSFPESWWILGSHMTFGCTREFQHNSRLSQPQWPSLRGLCSNETPLFQRVQWGSVYRGKCTSWLWVSKCKLRLWKAKGS